MHDIDTTRLEVSTEEEQFPHSAEEAEAYETDADEMMSEAEEEALAAELLGVTNEEELDQFLGGFFKKLSRKVRGAGRFLSRNAVPFSGILKNVAARGLPFLTGALGTAIPVPGVGTALGTAIGRAAGNLLQSEVNEMEAEEQEFEVSKRFVRLAAQAVRQGAQRPMPGNPVAAANLAVRRVLQQWRRYPGYYARRWPSQYACPPCPPCPPQSESQPGQGTTEAGVGAPAPQAPAPPPSQEFGYETEPQMEGEYLDETYDEAESEDYESESAITQHGRGNERQGGRWVRRGGRIILYGA